MSTISYKDFDIKNLRFNNVAPSKASKNINTFVKISYKVPGRLKASSLNIEFPSMTSEIGLQKPCQGDKPFSFFKLTDSAEHLILAKLWKDIESELKQFVNDNLETYGIASFNTHSSLQTNDDGKSICLKFNNKTKEMPGTIMYNIEDKELKRQNMFYKSTTGIPVVSVYAYSLVNGCFYLGHSVKELLVLNVEKAKRICIDSKTKNELIAKHGVATGIDNSDSENDTLSSEDETVYTVCNKRVPEPETSKGKKNPKKRK